MWLPRTNCTDCMPLTILICWNWFSFALNIFLSANLWLHQCHLHTHTLQKGSVKHSILCSSLAKMQSRPGLIQACAVKRSGKAWILFNACRTKTSASLSSLTQALHQTSLGPVPGAAKSSYLVLFLLSPSSSGVLRALYLIWSFQRQVNYCQQLPQGTGSGHRNWTTLSKAWWMLKAICCLTLGKKGLVPLCKNTLSAVCLEFQGEKVQKYNTIQCVRYPK